MTDMKSTNVIEMKERNTVSNSINIYTYKVSTLLDVFALSEDEATKKLVDACSFVENIPDNCNAEKFDLFAVENIRDNFYETVYEFQAKQDVALEASSSISKNAMSKLITAKSRDIC